MSVNRKCCKTQFDFHKKARSGKHKRAGNKPRQAMDGMTVTAWKRAGRPKTLARSQSNG